MPANSPCVSLCWLCTKEECWVKILVMPIKQNQKEWFWWVINHVWCESELCHSWCPHGLLFSEAFVYLAKIPVRDLTLEESSCPIQKLNSYKRGMCPLLRRGKFEAITLWGIFRWLMGQWGCQKIRMCLHISFPVCHPLKCVCPPKGLIKIYICEDF